MQFQPIQLEMTASADINGTKFKITGVGVVRSPGVYEATLNFSSLPKDFPPGLLATFLTSACCNTGASERAGSLNLGHTGATAYTAKRRVVSEKGGSIEMTAKASLSGTNVVIHADITGNLIAPYTNESHAIYYLTANPSQAGKAIVGIGEGSIFDKSGNETKVSLDQIFQLEAPGKIPNPLTKKEYRVLTEDGVLVGLTYRQRIHSICEPDDVFCKLDSKASLFE